MCSVVPWLSCKGSGRISRSVLCARNGGGNGGDMSDAIELVMSFKMSLDLSSGSAILWILDVDLGCGSSWGMSSNFLKDGSIVSQVLT